MIRFGPKPVIVLATDDQDAYRVSWKFVAEIAEVFIENSASPMVQSASASSATRTAETTVASAASVATSLSVGIRLRPSVSRHAAKAEVGRGPE